MLDTLAAAATQIAKLSARQQLVLGCCVIGRAASQPPPVLAVLVRLGLVEALDTAPGPLFPSVMDYHAPPVVVQAWLAWAMQRLASVADVAQARTA
jgi:hypothetical protein